MRIERCAIVPAHAFAQVECHLGFGEERRRGDGFDDRSLAEARSEKCFQRIGHGRLLAEKANLSEVAVGPRADDPCATSVRRKNLQRIAERFGRGHGKGADDQRAHLTEKFGQLPRIRDARQREFEHQPVAIDLIALEMKPRAIDQLRFHVGRGLHRVSGAHEEKCAALAEYPLIRKVALDLELGVVSEQPVENHPGDRSGGGIGGLERIEGDRLPDAADIHFVFLLGCDAGDRPERKGRHDGQQEGNSQNHGARAGHSAHFHRWKDLRQTKCRTIRPDLPLQTTCFPPYSTPSDGHGSKGKGDGARGPKA